MPDPPKKKKNPSSASKQGSEKSGSKSNEKSGKLKTDGSRPKSSEKSASKTSTSGKSTKGSGKGAGGSSKGGNKKGGKGKQLKESDSEDRPASPEKKTIQETFYKYLCCFCCFRYKSRKMVRKQQKEEEQKRLEEEERERLLAIQNLPVETVDEALELQRRQESAAKRIQAIARGRIGRTIGEVQRKKVRDEANEYWKEVKRLHDLEQDRQNRIRMARRMVS